MAHSLQFLKAKPAKHTVIRAPETDVPVRIRRRIIEVQVEQPSIGTVVPIASA